MRTATTFTPRQPPSGRWEKVVFKQVRCGACGHLFEAETPVQVTVEEWAAAVTDIVCLSCGGKPILMGQGRTLAEDRLFPHGSTIGDRTALWLQNGEKGNAALAIHERMTGRPRSKRDAPLDTSDLRRCMLLLARIPEWSVRMGGMADVSPVWSRLAPRWGEIADLYLEEVGSDLEKGQAPRTRALLDEIAAG